MGVDNQAVVRQELVDHLDGSCHVTSRVSTQVDNQTFTVLLIQFSQCDKQFRISGFTKLVDFYVAYLLINHIGGIDTLHRNVSTDLTIFTDFFNHHSDLDLNKLSASQTIDEFVENLKGSIYYEPMKRLSDIESPTLWDYEMALDLFYFGWFWKNGQKIFKDKEDRKIFMEAYGVKIDLLNMQWIYRSKRYYHMENSSIYAHIIPVTYHLTAQSIKDLVEAGNQDELTAAVRKTYYGKRYPELTPHNLDQYYTEIRHKIQSKEARNNPYSVATMVSYLYEKEHEVDRLTTILECVRYGLPQEEIAKYIHN